MKRYRFLFSLWLIFWLFIWVLSDNNIGIFILAASILCEAIEALLAFLAKKKLSVQLTVSPTAAKKAETVLTVSVNNSGLLSCKAKVKIHIRNLLTGEEDAKTVFTFAGRKSTAVATVSVRAEHCGKIGITATQISVYDAFGLFSFCKETNGKTAMLILPDIYPVELSVGQQRRADMSSDEYSMLRSGDDPGETFALREYRPGDKIKNIHWKLSEKIGVPTVRELGLTVNNSLLLLFDNSAVDKMQGSSMIELLGETVISISTALISVQFPHDISWLDRENGEVVVCHVAGEEELTAVMSGVLSATTVKEQQTVLEHFAAEHDLTEYAHILVITLNVDNTEKNVGNTNIVHLSPTITDKEEGLYVEA